MDRWDHTALLASLTQNLISVVAGAFGGKVKPEGPEAFHPFAQKGTRQGQRITKENFSLLRSIGDAVVNGRIK